jgi:hypothetical protein
MKKRCAKLSALEDPAMLNSKFFDDVSSRLSQLAAASPARDIEKNARALLTSAFARLDLVTREEFDIQTAVLARTREKLSALEARVAALEAAAAHKAT